MPFKQHIRDYTNWIFLVLTGNVKIHFRFHRDTLYLLVQLRISLYATSKIYRIWQYVDSNRKVYLSEKCFTFCSCISGEIFYRNFILPYGFVHKYGNTIDVNLRGGIEIWFYIERKQIYVSSFSTTNNNSFKQKDKNVFSGLIFDICSKLEILCINRWRNLWHLMIFKISIPLVIYSH